MAERVEKNVGTERIEDRLRTSKRSKNCAGQPVSESSAVSTNCDDVGRRATQLFGRASAVKWKTAIGDLTAGRCAAGPEVPANWKSAAYA